MLCYMQDILVTHFFHCILKMSILREIKLQGRCLILFIIIIFILFKYKMVAVHFVMVAQLLVLSVNYNMFTTHIF